MKTRLQLAVMALSTLVLGACDWKGAVSGADCPGRWVLAHKELVATGTRFLEARVENLSSTCSCSVHIGDGDAANPGAPGTFFGAPGNGAAVGAGGGSSSATTGQVAYGPQPGVPPQNTMPNTVRNAGVFYACSPYGEAERRSCNAKLELRQR